MILRAPRAGLGRGALAWACAAALGLSVIGCSGGGGEVEVNGPRTLAVGDTEITVSIAATPTKRRLGFAHRTEIGEDEGLLFIFKTPQMQQFWMKDVLVPIDIAFIDDTFEVTDLHTAQPPQTPGQVHGLKHYKSTVPVRYALEVKEGFFARHGVEVGDKIDLTAALRFTRVLP